MPRVQQACFLSFRGLVRLCLGVSILLTALSLNTAEAREMIVSRDSFVVANPDLIASASEPDGGFRISQGVKVTTANEVKDPNAPNIVWTKIEDASGRTGWVTSSALAESSVASQEAISRSAVSDDAESSQAYLINNDGSAARLVSNPSFQNTGKDVALLAVGTAVTSQETKPDSALTFLEWHRVEVTNGPDKGKEGWVTVGVLESTQARPANATHIIDNDGGAARVVPEPSFQAASNFANDVATVARGTPVNVTETKADPALGFLKWSRVEILTGPHKGKSGWVSANVLRGAPKSARTVEVRFRSFIPSPMVGFGGESVFNPFLGNLVFGGDHRGFGYGKPGYRSHQNVFVKLDPAAETPEIDQSRDWGLTRVYYARQARHVQGRPIWWLGPDGEQHPVLVEKLAVTKSNNSIDTRRAAGNAVVVHMKLSGGNPGEPMTKFLGKIDADVKVFLRENNAGDLQYRFDVQHDGFPAYELYIDGEEAYTHDPVAEKQHPLSLVGTGAGEFSKSSDWKVLPE